MPAACFHNILCLATHAHMQGSLSFTHTHAWKSTAIFLWWYNIPTGLSSECVATSLCCIVLLPHFFCIMHNDQVFRFFDTVRRGTLNHSLLQNVKDDTIRFIWVQVTIVNKPIQQITKWSWHKHLRQSWLCLLCNRTHFTAAIQLQSWVVCHCWACCHATQQCNKTSQNSTAFVRKRKSGIICVSI